MEPNPTLYGIDVRTHPLIPAGRAYLTPPDHPLIRALDALDDSTGEQARAFLRSDWRREIREGAAQTAILRFNDAADEPRCEVTITSVE